LPQTSSPAAQLEPPPLERKQGLLALPQGLPRVRVLLLAPLPARVLLLLLLVP
jgi:hypothetical protein